jgi:hypothetical protein
MFLNFVFLLIDENAEAATFPEYTYPAWGDMIALTLLPGDDFTQPANSCPISAVSVSLFAE